MLPKGARIMVRSWGLSRYSNRESVIIPYAGYNAIIDYAKNKNVDYIVIGQQCEWIRPMLDFMSPENIEPGNTIYPKYLELYGYSTGEKETNGKTERCVVGVYKLKK